MMESVHGGIPDQEIEKTGKRGAQALPGAQGALSAPRMRPGAECTTSPTPRSVDTSAVVSSRVRNPRRCSRVQLVARSGRMARNCWKRSAVLTSSGGTGTTPTKTRYKRTNMAGARRLGGGASPAFDAGKATPGITPPTGAGIVPGGPPCSPEWSTDAGATPSDPGDDFLALVRDALTVSLALVRDALTLCLRPPQTPDLLQGDKVRTGDGGPGGGSHGDKVCTSGARKEEGGGRTCGLSITGALTLLLALTPDNQPHQDAATRLPPGSTHARGTGRPRDREEGNPGTHATPRDPRDTEGS